METTYLATFLQVVDTGSMSEAARRIGVTPAAVAQQLRVLERELGVVLFARAGRTVGPTEAGHRLVASARGLVRDANLLRVVANEQAAAATLALGAINTALHGLLPEVLAGFVRQHPAVIIAVRSGMTSELYDAVVAAELDAAICLHPDFALPKTLHWQTLREEPLTVLAPARWAHRDPHELLASQPLIRYDRRLGGGRQAQRYLQAARIVPTERMELSSLEAIALIVERGLGVSLVPDASMPRWPGSRVAKLALPDAPPARRFGLLWGRTAERGRLVRALADEAARVVARV